MTNVQVLNCPKQSFGWCPFKVYSEAGYRDRISGFWASHSVELNVVQDWKKIIFFLGALSGLRWRVRFLPEGLYCCIFCSWPWSGPKKCIEICTRRFNLQNLTTLYDKYKLKRVY